MLCTAVFSLLRQHLHSLLVHCFACSCVSMCRTGLKFDVLLHYQLFVQGSKYCFLILPLCEWVVIIIDTVICVEVKVSVQLKANLLPNGA